MMILIVLIGIIIYRKALKLVLPHSNGYTFMTAATGACIELLAILVLSKVYEGIAIRMTDWEKHKTDTAYENALTIKVYCFQFANYYGTIFYVAFFKGQWVRFLTCVLSSSSSNFATKYSVNVKKAFPQFPFLIDGFP